MKTNRFLKHLAAFLPLATSASAQSTINSAHKYAYGANTGWLNLRPSAADGVVVGEAFLAGSIYAANFGWIQLGDGTPANGHTYSNTSATDFGVNHDGAGTLTGYGYSGNIGWVNFGWATVNDPNRPHFDLLTGRFGGYAYSANTGWINLAGNLITDTLASPDTDGDGMADAWEIQKLGNLTVAGIGTDKDKDGQSDAAEYAADTNPNQAAEYLRIVSQSYHAGLTRVTLQFATTRPTRIYQIQTSTSLLHGGTGGWAITGAAFLADPGTVTTRTASFTGGPGRFFRVVAQKPL
jgi:hypothetical protein